MLCRAVLRSLLSCDEISFVLHRLDRLVSTRFRNYLLGLAGWLVTESIDWRVWRDWLTWHNGLGLTIFVFERRSWL